MNMIGRKKHGTFKGKTLQSTLTCFLLFVRVANPVFLTQPRDFYAITVITRSGIMNTVILKPSTKPFFSHPKHGAIGRTPIYMICSQNEYMSGQIPLFSDTGVKIFTGKRRGKLRQYKNLVRWNCF